MKLESFVGCHDVEESLRLVHLERAVGGDAWEILDGAPRYADSLHESVQQLPVVGERIEVGM